MVLSSDGLNPLPVLILQDLKSCPLGVVASNALYMAGPVGDASNGAAVVIERIGAIPPREFCQKVSAEEMIRQSIYNRQAALAWGQGGESAGADQQRQQHARDRQWPGGRGCTSP